MSWEPDWNDVLECVFIVFLLTVSIYVLASLPGM